MSSTTAYQIKSVPASQAEDKNGLPVIRDKEGLNIEPNGQTHPQGENGSNQHEPDPREEMEELNVGFSNYWRIFTFCDSIDVFLYTVAMITSMASGASLPLMSIIFGQFATRFTTYDSAEPGASDGFHADVNTFVLRYVYLFIGRFLATYLATETVSIAGVRTTRAIRKQFLNKILRQEVAQFDKHTGTGSISTQVTTNGNRINQGIAEKLVILTQALSMFFSSCIIALVIQWKLALITMATIPAILTVASVCIAIDAVQESRVLRLHSQAAVLAQEALSSIKTVHAFWAYGKMIARYDEYLTLARKHGNRKSPNIGVANSIYYFCMFSGTALAFWQGFRMYASGEIEDVGTVLTVVLSITLGATSIAVVAPLTGALTNASSAAAELFELMDRPSLIDPLSPKGERPSECIGSIDFQNVSFAYPARSSVEVLQGISFSLPGGKTTALVGASGSGKSTIVGLLERWYEPASGEILLDGKPLTEYNTRWLRSSIRLVQQEPVLFRGTVFENVAKGFIDSQQLLPLDRQMELVQAACEISNAHNFVTELPLGYQTQVGERASGLSGGQKQRLAIARSIISNPKVLLLDEATSALDPRAEGAVQDALDIAAINRTTLVIAHKFSTIQAADNIIVMSKGNVVEQGTHQELLAIDGHYRSLVRAQNLSRGEEITQPSEKLTHSPHGHDDSPAELSQNENLINTELLDNPDVSAPTPNSAQQSMLHCFWIIFSEQKDLYPWFGALSLACLVAGGTYPVQAFLFSKLINVFTLPAQEAHDRANFFALMFFIMALANMLAHGTIGWAGNWVAHGITHRYRNELFSRFLSMDQEFFDRLENSSGALTSRLSSFPDAVQQLVAQNLFLVIVCFANVMASSVLAIAVGWKLGLVVVSAGMPILLGSGYLRVRIEQKFERDTTERFAESAALATEAVTSIRTVASLTLEDRICSEYNDSLDHISRSAVSTITYTSAAYALSQSLDFLLMALGFWYGSRLIASGQYTSAQFYLVFLAVMFGGQAAGQIFGYLTSATKAHVSANYILWLRTQKARIAENDQNHGVGPTAEGAFGLDKVNFSFKQRGTVRVLDNISLDISPDSFVAFVGSSGCGKSTIIALLERLYDPNSGRVTLGNRDIKDMSPRLYRNQISLVQQEPTLYEGSIRDNIALGLEHNPIDDQILDACRQANVLDLVSSLPDGLATPCGSKGSQFSGGQRQRLAIARALIRDPRILLLDEATSALDTQSERIVQQALKDATLGRMTVAVAHRLSTIGHADVIFVIADGKVLERGTHKELQSLKGRYYEMCQAQSFGQDSV